MEYREAKLIIASLFTQIAKPLLVILVNSNTNYLEKTMYHSHYVWPLTHLHKIHKSLIKFSQSA